MARRQPEYICPFCRRPMPACTTLGIFWLRHPNGRIEQRQLDRDGVEIVEDRS